MGLIAMLKGPWLVAAEVGGAIIHSALSFSHKVWRFKWAALRTEASLTNL